MDHRFPSEQLSIPYNSTYAFSDTEEDYLAHQSQAESYPDNFQSNGMEASSIPGSYPYPSYQHGPWGATPESEYWPSVPNTPNDLFYPQPQFPSNDSSQTDDRIIDPLFEGHLIDNDTRPFARMETLRAAGWGSTTSFGTVQEGTVDDLEAPWDSGSDPAGSSSMTIATTLSLPGSYLQSWMQDDDTWATWPSHGQVEDAAQSGPVTLTQGHVTAEQDVRMLRKKERNRIRKGEDRVADDNAYLKVCNLLAVKSKPKNKRSERILEGIETIDQDFETMCELLEISMTPRKTLAHRILERVEAMAERQEHDRDLQQRLEDSEAEVAILKSHIKGHRCH